MHSAQPEMEDGAAVSARVAAILSQDGVGRSLLAPRPARLARRNGREGVDITLRLPSYRSLPLSCIASVSLQIDGAVTDLSQAWLVLAGAPYRLDALGALADIWWFILDEAILFVPLDSARADSLQVSCTIETIEPYVTAGRLSFFNSAARTLVIEEALA